MNEIIVIIFYVINYFLYRKFNTIEPRNKVEEQDCCCSICLEDIKEDKITTFECKHNFHLKCLNQWVSKSPTCPECRTNLNIIYKIKINDTMHTLPQK